MDQAKEYVVCVKDNLATSKVDFFSYPRAKIEPKSKSMNHVDPALHTFAQKFNKVTNKLTQGQIAMTNKLTLLDKKRGSRSSYPP